jgi:hypothetical protein
MAAHFRPLPSPPEPQALAPQRAIRPASKASGAPAPPQRASSAEQVPANVEALGDKVVVSCFNGRWVAVLASLPAGSAFVGPPRGLGPFGDRRLPLVITAATCQMCDEKKEWAEFTRGGSMRLFRRLHRTLQDPVHTTAWGAGKIVCRACGRGEHDPPKTFLSNMGQQGIVGVTLELKVTIEDQGHVAVHETARMELGKDNQKKIESELYDRAAGALRDYFETTTHPMDSLDPMEEEMDTGDEGTP